MVTINDLKNYFHEILDKKYHQNELWFEYYKKEVSAFINILELITIKKKELEEITAYSVQPAVEQKNYLLPLKGGSSIVNFFKKKLKRNKKTTSTTKNKESKIKTLTYKYFKFEQKFAQKKKTDFKYLNNYTFMNNHNYENLINDLTIFEDKMIQFMQQLFDEDFFQNIGTFEKKTKVEGGASFYSPNTLLDELRQIKRILNNNININRNLNNLPELVELVKNNSNNNKKLIEENYKKLSINEKILEKNENNIKFLKRILIIIFVINCAIFILLIFIIYKNSKKKKKIEPKS